MPMNRVRQHLDDHHIQYSVIEHTPTFTAQKTAASAHISGKEVAKTVIVKADGDMIMVALPANHLVDLNKVKAFLDAQEVSLAHESEFEKRFPDCDVGTMPPFGNLYDMPVYVAQSLTEDEEIAFNAGSYRELLQMKYADFEKLVNPVIGDFSVET